MDDGMVITLSLCFVVIAIGKLIDNGTLFHKNKKGGKQDGDKEKRTLVL